MFEIFAAFGIWMATLIGIVVVGLIIGQVSNDYDCALRWFITCVLFSAMVTYFVFIGR